MNMKPSTALPEPANSNKISKKDLFATTTASTQNSDAKRTQDVKRGMQFLLASMAGITTAMGVTVCRWLLLETGEVILLLSNNGGDNIESTGTCMDDYADADYEGIDSDLISAEYSPFQCTNSEGSNTSMLSGLGQVILATATSPYLRSTPIFLLFLSSTAFVVGVLLTHKELQQLYLNIQSYQTACANQLKTTMGVTNMEELVTKLSKTQTQLKKSLGDQIKNAMTSMDGLVLDTVLRQIVQNGVDVTMGVWGGMILYSLPLEEMNSSAAAKQARRRLVRAADPTMERILFSPGGAWDVIPQCLRDFLRREISNHGLRLVNDTSIEDGSEPGSDSTADVTIDNDDDSSDTPLTSSPVTSVNVHVKSHRDEVNPKIPYAKVVRSGESSQMPDKQSNDTVTEALSAIINELVVSYLRNDGGQSRTDHDGTNNKQANEEQSKQYKEKHEQPQHTPPTPNQLEKYLHGTASIASFLFLYHLTRSPSTRRSWGSMMKMLTSLGLLSSAVGAGVASVALASNSGTYNSVVNNPIVCMLYSKLIQGLGMSPITNINDKIHTAIRRIQEAIRKDKRLQATIAFFILYSSTGLSRKYRQRIGTTQSRSR